MDTVCRTPVTPEDISDQIKWEMETITMGVERYRRSVAEATLGDTDPDKLKQITTILGAATSLGTLAFKTIEDLKSDSKLAMITDEVLAEAAEQSRTLAAIDRAGLVTDPSEPEVLFLKNTPETEEAPQ